MTAGAKQGLHSESPTAAAHLAGRATAIGAPPLGAAAAGTVAAHNGDAAAAVIAAGSDPGRNDGTAAAGAVGPPWGPG
jgi:hypothetical protein